MKTFIILATLVICVSCVDAEKEELDVLMQESVTNVIETYVEVKYDLFNSFEEGEELSVEDAIEVIGFVWMISPIAMASGHNYVFRHIEMRRSIERLYQEGFVISKAKEMEEGK